MIIIFEKFEKYFPFFRDLKLVLEIKRIPNLQLNKKICPKTSQIMLFQVSFKPKAYFSFYYKLIMKNDFIDDHNKVSINSNQNEDIKASFIKVFQ